MPSQLTRVVFRSIIANKPLLYRGCIHRTPQLRTALQYGVRTIPMSQRRTFFGLFKPQRKMKRADLPPGLEKMSELAHLQRAGERLLSPSDVAQALGAFFARGSKVLFEDFHVEIAHNAFQYLLKHPREDGEPWISLDKIKSIYRKLEHFRPQTGGKPHVAFAKALHAEVQKYMDEEEKQKDSTKKADTITKYEIQELPCLIRLMSVFGSTTEAREIVIKTYKNPHDSSSSKEQQAKEQEAIRLACTAVVNGYALENNASALTETLAMFKKLTFPITSDMLSIVISYFADNGLLDQAKNWYRQVQTPSNLGDALVPLLKACALRGELSFGHEVVALLLKEMPDKKAWNAIFVWSAAIGKGPDEIERMMNVMVRRNNEERQKNPAMPILEPDIDTINLLVDLSMSKKDSYSAERYVALGEKRGIFPDERTFTMQILYRLSIQDVDGARTAYYGLQGSMSGDEQTVTAVNQLIQTLCQSHQHHFDDIMAIVDDLHERKLRLAPETVSALVVLHLRRGETHDGIDLLQVHAHHLSPTQRAIIRKSLAAFILDGQTSTSDAWDGYQILRNVFPETSRDERVPIMNEFFARKRSDMGCHVFFHMRNHANQAVAPTKAVYVDAFTGFARNADAESLELVHNQLKLDLVVEIDTQIRNALMLAYAATGNNSKALQLWAEIGASKEGPTYNSIAIAFRSCEGMPFGDQHAKSIWRRLKEMDIEIDKQIFTAYLGAIARNHLHNEAIAIVESAEDEYGFTPDFYM